MKTVIGRSLIFAALAAFVTYFLRYFLKTDAYLSDVGGIGAFVTVFGTLYGIMAAFVVFEVWGQFNKTVDLIDQEAQGLERLYRLTVYFRDAKLLKEMKAAIKNYADEVIKSKFKFLAQGQRNTEAGKIFRRISEVIKEIKFDDDHDEVVFNHVLDHFGHLSEVRAQRITQSLARLPALLKAFLYISSGLALVTFMLLPFASYYYAILAVGSLAFVVGMIFHLVEDLDNPFVGHWTITPEPFERALRHIEEDY